MADEEDEYLLDTSAISILFRTSNGQSALERRLTTTPPTRRFICAVTVEEMVAGAMAQIRLAETRRRGTAGYKTLVAVVQYLNRFPIIPYDDEADAIYQSLPAATKRIGKGDCKIAAVALLRGMVVVTQNVRDFAAIPGVRAEDWTR